MSDRRRRRRRLLSWPVGTTDGTPTDTSSGRTSLRSFRLTAHSITAGRRSGKRTQTTSTLIGSDSLLLTHPIHITRRRHRRHSIGQRPVTFQSRCLLRGAVVASSIFRWFCRLPSKTFCSAIFHLFLQFYRFLFSHASFKDTSFFHFQNVLYTDFTFFNSLINSRHFAIFKFPLARGAYCAEVSEACPEKLLSLSECSLYARYSKLPTS